MRLHEDKSKFTEYTKAASVYFGINPALIEKDYYVTLFLSRAKDEIPGMVFKGGTSLSKPLSYKEAIKALAEIAESGVFEFIHEEKSEVYMLPSECAKMEQKANRKKNSEGNSK